MTSGNLTLDKNLECLEYNQELKQKLLNLKGLTSNFELCETELKEANLTYNGTPFHSQRGAAAEAKNIFAQAKNSPSSRHVIFGIGLGYLFKEVCALSKGIVFLYEPDAEKLRVAFELVDFSKELSQENVFVTDDFEMLKALYNTRHTYKASFDLLTLDSYKNILYVDKINDIIKKIKVMALTCDSNIRGVMEKGIFALEMVIKNLSSTLNATPLEEIKDTYKGKTALVVSAGPSLDSNIQTIKENRDKVVIFCVGTAFNALMKNGITPDFVNIIENADCSGQLMDYDLSEVNLITEPYTNHSVYLLNPKRNFLFPSCKAEVNKYWADVTGVDISSYTVIGTVSYAALASAKMLGFSKIILVGQDLAYLNNQCYSTNSAYGDLFFEIDSETSKATFKLKNKENYLNAFRSKDPKATQEEIEALAQSAWESIINSFIFVKGISGESLPSHTGMASFIEFFNTFAHQNKDVELINSSMQGAQIDGFKNISLEEALIDSGKIEKTNINKKFNYDKTAILFYLSEDIEKLGHILEEFNDAKRFILNYEKEFSRRKTITPDCIKNLQMLLGLYDKINAENQDILYKIISYNEDLELMYELNEGKEPNAEYLKRLFSLLKNYFENIYMKSASVLDKLKEQKELINESIDSKG